MLAVRAEGRTAQEASSGNWPWAPTRTRSTSSRSAVIWITAVLERISIPLEVGREAVTRSRRTKPDFCWASAVVLACDVAAKNNIPSTAREKRLALCNQHLMGVTLLTIEKNNALSASMGNTSPRARSRWPQAQTETPAPIAICFLDDKGTTGTDSATGKSEPLGRSSACDQEREGTVSGHRASAKADGSTHSRQPGKIPCGFRIR